MTIKTDNIIDSQKNHLLRVLPEIEAWNMGFSADLSGAQVSIIGRGSSGCVGIRGLHAGDRRRHV